LTLLLPGLEVFIEHEPSLRWALFIKADYQGLCFDNRSSSEAGTLKKALEAQKTESLEMNKKAINYGVLQRQVESSQQMCNLLIQRFKEKSLSEEMKTANIRVIDKAQVPKVPFKPNKKRDLLLAMVLGLFLSLGMAFFLEYLDNTIKLPEEMKTLLNIPYLGPVPAFGEEEPSDDVPSDLITVYSPKSTASESFRGNREY
jgi:polysaccharide biosynthesis transport protein